MDSGDLDHYDPPMLDGSPHVSDDEEVDPPEYKESSDEDEYDGTVFANINQDRLQHTIDYWCTCKFCQPMSSEKECVCCRESQLIGRLIGPDETCVTQTGQFKEFVLSEEGIRFARYLYSLNIEDEEKKARYLAADLSKPSKMRFLAYKQFINQLSSTEFDRQIRYILPACVVTAIRSKFPNPEGVNYKGYITLSTSECTSLP